jgi:hypothetical protein
MTDFPGKGKVAVLKTSPQTVLEDIDRLMRLAGVEQALPKDVTTGLKINISWQTWYPACSSTPWQLEGVIRGLQGLGYNDLLGIHNDTVVVDTSVGEANNKHRFVTDQYGVPCLYLYEEKFEWERYVPRKRPFLVLDKVYPDGVYIPNAFGGLLHRNRHWTHSVIHETLVDLLMIQQEIHPGLFAVMDGTFAGDGPGPRAMHWHEKNILLASADQVAIDAVSAKLQGFDPMSIPFLRIAHELGLGVADPREIEIVGYDINQEQPWNFVQTDTFASKGQKLIYHGPLKPLEKVLLQSPIVPWSYFASNFYHNVYWYPFVGRKRVESALQNPWGQLFANYGDGSVVMPGVEPKTVVQAAVGIGLATALLGAAAWLLTRKDD